MNQGLIDDIKWGGWHWVTPGSPQPVIKYYFATAGEFGTYDTNWTSIEKAAYRAAVQSWANVANVAFVEESSASAATFIEHSVSSAFFNPAPGTITLGQHDVPDNPAPADGYYNYQGYGWDYSNANGGLQVGGFGYLTLVHELGHGLGLAHPHDDGGGSGVWPGVTGPFVSGTYDLNQDINTVMSYVHGLTSKPLDRGAGADNYGYVAGPMAFDIAAIQDLYGANMSYHTGNDVYRLPDVNAAGTYFSCIWDAGGKDSIVYDGSRACVINLKPASLDFSPTGGGDLSRASGIYGGFTIAHGVWIERATGGSGEDNIVGNRKANVLKGHGGDDTLLGKNGHDRLIGGAGRDIQRGGPGSDEFVFKSIADSGVKALARDRIADFHQWQYDKLDVHKIDADVTLGGLQHFVFIGTESLADYHSLHDNVVGMLRFNPGNHRLMGNVDGDFAHADFAVTLLGVNALSAGDLILV